MQTADSDPRQYLKVIWRWKFVFLALLILVPLAAYLITSRTAKVYESGALLQEQPLRVDTSLFSSGAASPSSGTSSPQVLGGEARTIETPSVARLAARRLTPAPANANSLLGHITAAAMPNTGFITITAKAGSARRAADIANAFAQAVVHLRISEAVSEVGSTITRITDQLNQLNSDIRSAPGKKNTGPLETEVTQLSANLQQLRAIKDAQVANADVLQAAAPTFTPTSPKLGKTVGLAAVIGLLLGIAGVLVAETADRRVRQPEQLEELAQLPLLAVIPRSAFSPQSSKAENREAFQMLRSSLRFANVDNPVTTLLVVSPMQGDGKTTVATSLAIAAAVSGQDVVLIDGDMRRPRAEKRLQEAAESSVDPADTSGNHTGLAGVLAGTASLADELISVSLGHPGEETNPPIIRPGRLRVLPTVNAVPNPAELLASTRMKQLLARLGEISNLVIVDTSPLLGVSDAWPLVETVSGVLVVSRLGYTRKAAIRRLMKMFANTNAQLIGVAATGATRASIGDYGYGYAGYVYTPHGDGSSLANGSGDNSRRLSVSRLRPRRRPSNPGAAVDGTAPQPAVANGTAPQPAVANGSGPQPAAVNGTTPEPAGTHGTAPTPAPGQNGQHSADRVPPPPVPAPPSPEAQRTQPYSLDTTLGEATQSGRSQPDRPAPTPQSGDETAANALEGFGMGIRRGRRITLAELQARTRARVPRAGDDPGESDRTRTDPSDPRTSGN